jgi:hypothetical protein
MVFGLTSIVSTRDGNRILYFIICLVFKLVFRNYLIINSRVSITSGAEICMMEKPDFKFKIWLSYLLVVVSFYLIISFLVKEA